jgi:hypothetical protein
MQREECRAEACRATFEASSPQHGDVRYCNRGGPDGGHSSRWDGTQWHGVSDSMEHDRK